LIYFVGSPNSFGYFDVSHSPNNLHDKVLQNISTSNSGVLENEPEMNLSLRRNEDNISRRNEVSEPDGLDEYVMQLQNPEKTFSKQSPVAERSSSAFESYNKSIQPPLNSCSSQINSAALLSTFSIIANFEPAKSNSAISSTQRYSCNRGSPSDHLNSSEYSDRSLPTFQNPFTLDLDQALKSSPTASQKRQEEDSGLQNFPGNSLPGIKLPPLHLPCPEEATILSRGNETFILPKTSQQQCSQSIEVSRCSITSAVRIGNATAFPSFF